jgi:calcineurin-like phosphoesterase family protein
MSSHHSPVVFVWPGDLHFTRPDAENHRAALHLAEDINAVIKPNFVQFAGDNAQNATDEQFEMFNDLRRRLNAPSHALVGDHDVHHDPHALAYRAHVGEPYGAFSVNGYRFIRLNTMEFRPLGMTNQQIHWFRYEADCAIDRGERIVLFQHHYPFQIWEDFDGPGIDGWREIVQTRRITAIFAGHTHYGQIANDGRNVSIATRSIGEPEGGSAGYSVVYLHGDDLAVKYRTVDDKGPFVMTTHPRSGILALSGKHIISGPDTVRVRVWSQSAPESVEGQIDGGEWFDLSLQSDGQWSSPIEGQKLKKGEHSLHIRAKADGATATDQTTFMVDRTGRYTAYPKVVPEVLGTKFC